MIKKLVNRQDEESKNMQAAMQNTAMQNTNHSDEQNEMILQM